jgi:hypothetical protein
MLSPPHNPYRGYELPAPASARAGRPTPLIHATDSGSRLRGIASNFHELGFGLARRRAVERRREAAQRHVAPPAIITTAGLSSEAMPVCSPSLPFSCPASAFERGGQVQVGKSRSVQYAIMRERPQQPSLPSPLPSGIARTLRRGATKAKASGAGTNLTSSRRECC